jgi:hypothetical protein
MQERLVTMDTAGSWRRILTQSNPLEKGEDVTLCYDSHNGPDSDVWVTLMTARTNKLFIARSTVFTPPYSRYVYPSSSSKPISTNCPHGRQVTLLQTSTQNFNCCLSVHVDNYTIIIPTKCTSFLLLKAQDVTICTFCLVFLPLHVSTRVDQLQGAQCQCLAKVIIDYNLLKLH